MRFPVRKRFWALMGIALLAVGHVVAADPSLQKFVFEKAEMGVPFRLTFYALNEAAAQSAAKAAFARVEVLNSIFSDYDPDSELSRLLHSAPGRPIPVSDRLWRILDDSRKMSEQSGGAFDVTVGPLVNLWRRARRKRELPATAELEEARQRVGYRKLRFDPEKKTVELRRGEMRLDLGGIAKGVAVDAALAVLKENGITSALAAASGDIGASNPPPGKRGWRVEVAALDTPGAPIARHVWLSNSAVSTAGDTFQHVVINGVRYSHIIDPRTGIGLTDHTLVTVLGPTCAITDSLETTLAVLGPERGLRLIAQHPGTAAYIVRKPGEKVEVVESPRWATLAGESGSDRSVGSD